MKNKILRFILAIEIIIFVFFMFKFVILTNGNGCDNTSDIQKKEMCKAFNSKLEAYIESDLYASHIRSLIALVITSNASQRNIGSDKIVKINGVEPKKIPQVSNNSKYNITVSYDDDGFIEEMITNPFIDIK